MKREEGIKKKILNMKGRKEKGKEVKRSNSRKKEGGNLTGIKEAGKEGIMREICKEKRGQY